MKLITEGLLRDYELCSICTIKAIDAIRSRNATLQLETGLRVVAVLEESNLWKYVIRNYLPDYLSHPDRVLLRRTTHVPCMIQDFLVFR